MSNSADLITLTVRGVFSTSPNRTITIDRPTIDPASIPVRIQEGPFPTSTSTAGPFLIVPPPKRELDDKILTALLAGLIPPIVLVLLIIIFFRYRTSIIAKKYGIPFSFLTTWSELQPASTASNSPPTDPLTPSPKKKSIFAAFKSSGQPSPLGNVGQRLNSQGQLEYYCKNHLCTIDPKTKKCEYQEMCPYVTQLLSVMVLGTKSGVRIPRRHRLKTKPQSANSPTNAGPSNTNASGALRV
ncbi:hypothetical protein BKA66DRAFT_91196 [Pyrenochaeta sp. MPI-SDFR-AT-0127]|nr:hypothetical protein BKA66DRAFT_91196 [Pyrenochaeta sp. MPI-SDFR-AT-0127]